MTLQQVLSQVRRAADDYEMIQDGDKIAVGISGGKDSLTLLYALSTLRRFYPHPFELHAVTVDLGFENLNLGKIEALCKELDVPYTIVPTQIASIVFDQRKEKNPCALCAKMRKGALNEAIRGAGCNKIAYAHHKDDVVETLMLSLIYEGRFHTFSPVTFLDRMNLTVIRPLVLAPEADIRRAAAREGLPIVKNKCPADGTTTRQETKEWLAEMERKDRGFTYRLFGALRRSGIDGWGYPEKESSCRKKAAFSMESEVKK